MKITKGKCTVQKDGKLPSGAYQTTIYGEINQSEVAITWADTEEESESNAELITEAFNVANETGYSPGELADRNAELLEACKSLLSCIDSGMDVMESMDKGHQAIQKSTKHNYLLKL